MNRANFLTAWQGHDIVVFRDEREIDRVHGPDIQRVVLAHTGAGETPGDLVWALIELADEHVLLAAETGIAGRIHFERHDFWAERGCIYWVPIARAHLPSRLRPRSSWLNFGRAPQMVVRAPKVELAPIVDSWPLQGPQTWDERKWQRIQRNRPFASMPEVARPPHEAATAGSTRPRP